MTILGISKAAPLEDSKGNEKLRFWLPEFLENGVNPADSRYLFAAVRLGEESRYLAPKQIKSWNPFSKINNGFWVPVQVLGEGRDARGNQRLETILLNVNSVAKRLDVADWKVQSWEENGTVLKNILKIVKGNLNPEKTGEWKADERGKLKDANDSTKTGLTFVKKGERNFIHIKGEQGPAGGFKKFKKARMMTEGTEIVVARLVTNSNCLNWADSAAKTKYDWALEGHKRTHQVLEKIGECPVIVKRYASVKSKNRRGKEQVIAYDELFNQGSLFNVISNNKIGKQLSSQQKDQIAENILDALSKLHKNGIYHRDIKIENVVVNLDDIGIRAALCDLDLAYTGPEHLEEAGGTSLALSPERALNLLGRRLVTTSDLETGDIWAMGLALYVLYTGKYPEIGEAEKFDGWQWIGNSIDRDGAAFNKSAKDGPRLQLIWEMLQFRPEKRPSIENVLERFRKIVKDENIPQAAS
jgi:serine/threonine protein kinase